jgi:hypothetical protein
MPNDDAVIITVAGHGFTADELTTLVVSAGEIRDGGSDEELSTLQLAILDKARDAYRAAVAE